MKDDPRFENSLRSVFGESAQKFSEDLRSSLHELWVQGVALAAHISARHRTVTPLVEKCKSVRLAIDEVLCPECEGYGWFNHDLADLPCHTCSGHGKLGARCRSCFGDGFAQDETGCWVGEPCRACGGEKRERVRSSRSPF